MDIVASTPNVPAVIRRISRDSACTFVGFCHLATRLGLPRMPTHKGRSRMIIRFLAALSLAIPLATLSASLATAQSANQMPGMDADMPLAGPQPPAKIVVDPPLPRTVEPRGRVH